MPVAIQIEPALYAQGKTKDLVSGAGVRVERYQIREPREVSADDTVEALGTDLVVKPVDQGSSVALHLPGAGIGPGSSD